MRTPEDYPIVPRRTWGYSYSELNPIRQGFLGLFHPYNGTVFAGEGINEDQDLYQAYLFGENAIISRPEYGKYVFKDNIEKHCLERDINRVFGILLPPSESGTVNNPKDLEIFNPALPYPGMIQGAKRFSELSKLFPQIAGVIIDDFWRNYGGGITYENLRDIKDALLGKIVKDNGEVDHQSDATTPNLKLFVVTYERELRSPDEYTFNLIDGINFWLYNQENLYKNFDEYIKSAKAYFVDKEIIPGIYIKNGDYGEMSHESIIYMIERCVDLYDKGQVTGVLLFSGYWLVKDYISKERSLQINLSNILNYKYYPFLGEIKGQIFDQATDKYIEKALIKIVSARWSDVNERIIAQKFTNTTGSYRFSGWAGFGPGGLDFEIHVEREGYEAKIMKFKLLPGKVISMPPIILNGDV